MSNYGAPGQFDDSEIERQIQEEFRRRQQQALQSASGMSALSAARGRQPDAYSQHHISMMQHQADAAAANSPFAYTNNGVRGAGAGHHNSHSPYTRVTNPYGGIADARAAYSQGRGGSNSTPQATPSDAVAQLYAAQQRRAQLANSYGYVTAPGSRSALDQHYGAYGMNATPAPAVYSHDYGHENAYGAQSPHHEAAMQQAHMQDSYARSSSNPTPASSYPSSARRSPVEGNESSRNTPVSDVPGGSTKKNKTYKTGTGGKNKEMKQKNPMLQKVTSTINKPKITARVVIKDGVTMIEDGNLTWFTGCVPLGVEDDKYWLSELQVYLRGNFAEAFGATEEDIAAPMHGRNKPIALGQVGIRCLHCKSKLFSSVLFRFCFTNAPH